MSTKEHEMFAINENGDICMNGVGRVVAFHRHEPGGRKHGTWYINYELHPVLITIVREVLYRPHVKHMEELVPLPPLEELVEQMNALCRKVEYKAEAATKWIEDVFPR